MLRGERLCATLVVPQNRGHVRGLPVLARARVPAVAPIQEVRDPARALALLPTPEHCSELSLLLGVLHELASVAVHPIPDVECVSML